MSLVLNRRVSITRYEFDLCMVKLRLNVSFVSRELGIPRTYLCEWRNGTRYLDDYMRLQVRGFFESRGIVFNDAAAQCCEWCGADVMSNTGALPD